MKSNRKAAFSVRQRGFTMAEMLVVMAVIMVLSGIAVPNAARIRNNVRQMSLNRSAETIYMTAQRNLIADKVRDPLSYPPGYGVENIATGTIYIVTSFQAHGDTIPENTVANTVLSAKTISPALYDGNWRIEYDGSFRVIRVYYSEDLTLDLETEYNSGKIGKVGRYG